MHIQLLVVYAKMEYMYARDETGTILITVIEQTKAVSNHKKKLHFSCFIYTVYSVNVSFTIM